MFACTRSEIGFYKHYMLVLLLCKILSVRVGAIDGGKINSVLVSFNRLEVSLNSCADKVKKLIMLKKFFISKFNFLNLISRCY